MYSTSGNEGRPFQGIDTVSTVSSAVVSSSVEMKVAPFRALTPVLHVVTVNRMVEMKVAPFRALTLPRAFISFCAFS